MVLSFVRSDFFSWDHLHAPYHHAVVVGLSGRRVILWLILWLFVFVLLFVVFIMVVIIRVFLMFIVLVVVVVVVVVFMGMVGVIVVTPVVRLPGPAVSTQGERNPATVRILPLASLFLLLVLLLLFLFILLDLSQESLLVLKRHLLDVSLLLLRLHLVILRRDHHGLSLNEDRLYDGLDDDLSWCYHGHLRPLRPL